MRPAYLLSIFILPAIAIVLARSQPGEKSTAHAVPQFSPTVHSVEPLFRSPIKSPRVILTAAKTPARPVRTPKPVPSPTAAPGPTPAPSQTIRVGLSTAGAPAQFYSSGALGVTDSGQPGRRLVVPAGQLLKVTFGAVTAESIGGKRFTGPIVVQSGKVTSKGWSRVSIYVTAQPARFSSNGANPRWSRPYRGHFEVWPQRSPEPNHRKGNLTVINKVPLEDYLKGVVPWEMSPSAPLEALKAQAICARTKTIQQVQAKRFAAAGFDVCDYDACQGYPGTENEKPRSTEAVEKTAGLAVFYKNRPIDAVYSTNSGGITSNATDVWRSTASVPYLDSMRDFAPKSPAFQIVKSKMVESDWLAYCSQALPSYARPGEEMKVALAARRAKSPFAARLFGPEDWPEFYRWKREFSAEEVNKAFSDRGLAQVTNIEVVQRTGSGRIRQLRIAGYGVADSTAGGASTSGKTPALTTPTPAAPNQNILLEGDAAVRSMLSKRLGSTTALPSSLFVVTPRTDASGQLSGWLLQGAGWGHGVGMCQRGAQNHALEGWDARRILNWYYRNVEIRKISP